MNIRTHQVPAETLAALGTGGGGTDAVQPLVAAQYSKHLLLVWAVRTMARETGHPQASQAGLLILPGPASSGDPPNGPLSGRN